MKQQPKFAVRLASKFFARYVKKLNGLENLPNKGGYILVSNQNSQADGVAIAITLVNKKNAVAHVVANFKSRSGKWLNEKLIYLLELFTSYWIKMITVRKNDSISKSVKTLQKGYPLIIFPEAKVNYDKKSLLKARSGAVRIALLSKKLLIPVGILGSEKTVPNNTFIPKNHKVTLNFGKPIDFSNFYGKEDDRKVLEKLSRKMMKEIGLLCNKSYLY